ncbi:ABC transporter permease subunit [Shimazuella kribbensis]|uniref:ABC transporter permease subunit n=1 Tax=Shimazuella kribbensis TaxID=139808 RepID=UPI003CCC0BAF
MSRLLGKQLVISVLTTLLALITLAGIFAPFLAPHDPNLVDLSHKLNSPSLEFPLGTDQLGRCVLSRLLYGTRVTLSLTLLIVASCVAIALIIGSIAGYVGGLIDNILMRVCDTILSFPSFILAICLISIWGVGWQQMVFVLITIQSVYYTRFIRGLVTNLRQQNYILAAKVCGSSPFLIMIRHIIPNLLSPLVIVVTLEIGWVIMDISALSFIGLGVQSPTPEWGAMINEGKSFLLSHPRLLLAPGIMIFCVVALFNLLGETLGGKKGTTKSIRKSKKEPVEGLGGTQ